MDSEKRLKIAIQKSGRLADMSLKLLEKCGIQLSRSRDQPLFRSQNFPLDVFLVRDDDIPAFLATDVCQLGVLGQMLVKNRHLAMVNFRLREELALGYGQCRLSIAVPQSFYNGTASLEGKTIVPTYGAIWCLSKNQ